MRNLAQTLQAQGKFDEARGLEARLRDAAGDE